MADATDGQKSADVQAGGKEKEAAKPPPDAAAAVKMLPQDEVDRIVGERAQKAAERARNALLAKFKDHGVGSEEELETLVKAAHEAKQAQLSELEKAKAKTQKLEAELAEAKAHAAKSTEESRRLRVFNGAGVKDADVAGFLLDKAKAEGGEGFDEAKWLKGLKAERPYLFGQEAAPEPKPATTGQRTPAAQANGAGKAAPFNALTATKEELIAHARATGLDPNLFRF